MSEPVFIHSRDNALVKELRRLAQDNTAYRTQGRVWLEGDHLCRALLQRGQRPTLAVFCESFWQQRAAAAPAAHEGLMHAAPKTVVLADALWASITALQCPAALGMGFVVPVPCAATVRSDLATVVLDRLQDAGNVGSVLRSAAAFGFTQIVALKGSAALWSPKVLRAGMGAHFALRLIEGLAEDGGDVLDALLPMPLLVTDVHGGEFLHRAALPWPCAWVLGHEGQGVSSALQARAAQRIRIVQPGGQESLNVAAAAAICLHASAVARSVERAFGPS